MDKIKEKKKYVEASAKMACVLLANYDTKKVRSYFNEFREKSHLQEGRKKYLLSQIVAGHIFCVKQQYFQGLRKIEWYSTKNNASGAE